uniref:Uncharacterized protein n=1 Tax=Avena sativa TaxID=4498 RepID=A0ACD5YEB0_AVESA
MAVAEDAVNPSPPPARIVVVVLALVRVVVRALLYLVFATSWVFSAIGVAMLVARLFWGEGSAPFVFLLALAIEAVKVFGKFILVVLVAVVLCDRFLVQFVSGSVSEFGKSPFEAGMEEATRGLFTFFHIVALGFFADLAFIPLIVTGILVMILSSSEDGSTSQGEMIGSVILDVGFLGIHAISFFLIIPAVMLGLLMKGQADRKAGLPVADC